MNQRNLKLWLDALRSGQFEQGQRALNKGGKYCCLGVLCEVAIRDGVKVEKRQDPDGYWAYDGYPNYPPRPVMDWLGHTSRTLLEVTLPNGEGSTAITMNDHLKATFDEIADAMERTYGEKVAA